MTIDQAILKEVLTYEEETGNFLWRKALNRKIKVGTVAGYTDPEKYIRIKLFGKVYKAHNLVWLYFHGEFPENLLDHKDKNPGNNKKDNLRPCTPSQNIANREGFKNKSSVFKGVNWNKSRRKWRSHIKILGKQFYLGSFDKELDAAKAYDKAAFKYFGEFAVLNFGEKDDRPT